MIKFFAPGLTALQAGTFVLNKAFPMTYYASAYYDPADPLNTTAGIIFEAHVNDEQWQTVKAAIVSLTGVQLTPKMRVWFASMDPSHTAGRPGPKLFYVNSDGSQTET